MADKPVSCRVLLLNFCHANNCDSLLQYLPLGKYSAFNIIMWGVMLAFFATAKSFSGAAAIRFFLGLFEAAVTPGFALFTSQWYTRKEQGTRMSIWFSFNGFAQIIGGLIAYGIARRGEQFSIAPWRVFSLLTGLLTIAVGIIFFFIMPDNQMNAWWLGKEDQVRAIERIRINQQGIGNKCWKLYQVKEALSDPLTWAICFFAFFATVPNGELELTYRDFHELNSSRWYIQLLLSSHTFFWLHIPTGYPLRHSRRSC